MTESLMYWPVLVSNCVTYLPQGLRTFKGGSKYYCDSEAALLPCFFGRPGDNRPFEVYGMYENHRCELWSEELNEG